jgi:hypothetical protein
LTVFRWIMGVIGGLLAAGWFTTVALYVTAGDDRFKELGTRLRRWTITIALFWFNIEIWGRVIWTVITWNRPPSA